MMRQAAMAWNMHHNRDAAEKFQRKALDAVTREVGVCDRETDNAPYMCSCMK